MQTAGLDEAQAELRLSGEISINSDMQMTIFISSLYKPFRQEEFIKGTFSETT